MKRALSLSLLLTLTIVAVPVSGAMIKGGENLSIDTKVDDDLYVAGGQVDILENVSGDLLAVGGQVNIQGNTGEDLSVAGGRISVTGSVGDDARMAGGEVRISGSIDDDLFVTGGRIEINEGTVINGDLRAAGGDIYIDGTVKGSVDIRGGRVILHGKIGGNVDVAGDSIAVHADIGGTSKLVAEEISVGSAAMFHGNVTYWQREGPIDMTANLDGAGAAYDMQFARSDVTKSERTFEKYLSTAFLLQFIFSLLFAAFFIFLVALLTKRIFSDAAKKFVESWGRSIVTGFLYFVVTPIAIFLLMLTIIGIPISLFSGVLYGFSIYFAKALTAMVAAKYLEVRRRKRKYGFWGFVGMSTLLYALLSFLSLIPILGWVIVFLCVFAAYGAIILTRWEKFQRTR